MDIIIAVSSAILGYFTSRIANRKIKHFSHHIVAILVVSVLTVFFYLGISKIKSVFNEENKLVGRWIEKYDEEGKPLYALTTFEYNSSTGVLEFKGMGYNSSGQIMGRWRTYEASFDGVEYSYLFTGRSENEAKKGERKGIGSIGFEDNFRRGKGHFFSVSSDSKPRDFYIYKITNEEAIKESKENQESFVRKLYENENYLKEVTSPQ